MRDIADRSDTGPGHNPRSEKESSFSLHIPHSFQRFVSNLTAINLKSKLLSGRKEQIFDCQRKWWCYNQVMNKKTIIVLAAVILLVTTSVVFAKYNYYIMFQKAYPKTVNSRIDFCICHQSKDGGGPRNFYGTDFERNRHDLKAIEDKDSDNDGYKNIDEIKALTNPGDNADYPKDKNPPTIEITSPKMGDVIKVTKLTVSGNATDDRLVSRITIRMTGFEERTIGPKGNVWESTYEIRKNGYYDINAIAYDSSGNASTEAHLSVKVDIPDKEPPDIQFFYPVEDMVLNSLPIKVSGIAYDVSGINNVEYSLDDKKTWSKAEGLDEWFFIITAIEEGEIVAWVRAQDSLGNVCPPAFQRFRLAFDKVATPTISYPANGMVLETEDLIISGTLAPPAVKVGVVFDDGQEQWATNDRYFWSLDIGKIKPGKHTITACAYDQLNRKSEKCANVEFEYIVIDQMPPTIVVTSPREGQEFELGNLTVSGRAKDDISGLDKVEASIDGKSWQTQTTESFSFTFNLEKAGDYIIYVKATDKSGNFTPMPTTINVTVLPVPGIEVDLPTKEMQDSGEISAVIRLSRKSMPQPIIIMSGTTRTHSLTKIKDRFYRLDSFLSAGSTKITVESQGVSVSFEVTHRVVIEFVIGKKIMTVNGLQQTIKTAPTLVGGKTFIPFRVIGDALRAKVDWDAETKTATYTLGDYSYSLIVGSNNAFVNGKPVPVSTPPMLIGGSLMIPIRVFSDILGGSVAYDKATKKITLVYPK